MLFGLFQGSRLKEIVEKSITSHPENWNFDKKSVKTDRIQEVFTALHWKSVYNKTAGWDFLGWDRSVRMDKVKKTIEQVSAKEKIKLLPQIKQSVISQRSIEEQKTQFPLLKTTELTALQNLNSLLYTTDCKSWKSIKQSEKKHSQKEELLVLIQSLSKDEISRFCQIIREGVNGKISKLSQQDKQFLLSLVQLYRNHRHQRETLSHRIQDLFEACDTSSMILFAIENSIHREEKFFTEQLHPGILSSLNERSKHNGLYDELGKFTVLECLNKLGIHLFSKRNYVLVKHKEDKTHEVRYISNSMPSLQEALSELSGNNIESHSRAVQAAIHDDAVHKVTGNNAGGLQWKIEELSKPFLGNSYLSQKFDSERVVTEIHDFGNGDVKIKHIVTADIQQNPMGTPGPIIGSYRIATTYSIAQEKSGSYTIQNQVCEPVQFSWKITQPHPFTSLKVNGVEPADLKQLYLDDVNFQWQE